jgi:putative inorganic carbon (HCO3(-)) transporter
MALIVIFLVLQWYFWSPKMPVFWGKVALPLGLGGLVAMLLLGIILVPAFRDRVSTIFSGRGDSSNNFRMNVWTSVSQMIKDRPILGIGPGNNAFNKIYPLYMKSRYTALSAYSIWLEIAVETGIIGLASFVWLLIVTFNQGYLQLKRLRENFNPEAFWLMSAIAAMVGMLAHGCFDTVWYRPTTNMLWWFMVALIASYYIEPQKETLIQDLELEN